MSIEVRENPQEARYEIWTEGQLAGFAQYRRHDGRITFLHTEIYPEHQGAGLGGLLAAGALEDARTHRLSVVPVCPFIADYIRRHPDDYLDMVVPAMRARVRSGD